MVMVLEIGLSSGCNSDNGFSSGDAVMVVLVMYGEYIDVGERDESNGGGMVVIL